MRVLVNGVEIDDWLWNQDLGDDDVSPQTLTEREIADVALSAGDVIEVRGFRDSGREKLHTDYLDFDFDRPFDGAPPPMPFRVEAEDFALVQGFFAASRPIASDRAIIETTSDAEAVARLVFSGADGVYDLALGYYDENDGVAQMRVLVNGVEVDDWLWNQNLGGSDLSSQTLTEREIAGVDLRDGDVIELRGFRDGGAEKLRTDYLDFAFVDDLVG